MLVCVYLLLGVFLLVTDTVTSLESSPGESVVLQSNICEDTKRDKWTFTPDTSSIEYKDTTEVSNERGTYKDRVKVFNEEPSRKFSLLISDLTENDSGRYWCGESKYVDLAVKGCSLLENKQQVEISRSPGQSVFLSCSCTHQQDTPVRVEWRSPGQEDLFSSDLSPHYRGRVQRFSERSSGNLSLMISDLTEEHGGLYSCWINHNQHRNFSLTIKAVSVTDSAGLKGNSTVTQYNVTAHFGNATGQSEMNHLLSIIDKHRSVFTVLLVILLLLIGAVCIYYKCVKGRKNTDKENTGEIRNNEANVIYSSIAHGKKGQITQKQGDESITYSEVSLSKKQTSSEQEADVIYSSIAHGKKGQKKQKQGDESMTYSEVSLPKKQTSSEQEHEVTYSTMTHIKKK